eukprot:gene885-1717_t
MSLATMSSAQNMAMSPGVAAWNKPNSQYQQPVFDNIQTDSKPSLGIAENDSTNMYRGNFSGDLCFTLDISDEICHSSVWLEERCECISVKLKSTQSQAIIGITTDGNEKITEYLSSKRKIENGCPEGILIGSSSDITKKATKDDIDIIKPFHLLCSNNVKISDKKDELNTNTIELTKSSPKGANPIKLSPEQLGGLYIAHWANLASDLIASADPSSKESQSKNKKSKKKHRINSVSLVIHSSFNYNQRQSVLKAIQQLSIPCTGLVSKGLASVAGALTRANIKTTHSKESPELLPVLSSCLSQRKNNKNKSKNNNNNNNKDQTIIVLVVIKTGTGSWDVSLVQCDATQTEDNKTTGNDTDNDVCVPCDSDPSSTSTSRSSGSGSGSGSGNDSGYNPFDLLTVLAVAGSSQPFPSSQSTVSKSESERERELFSLLDEVLRTVDPQISKSSISAILHANNFCNSENNNSSNGTAALSDSLKRGDAARGACLLTASQLDSSRIYLRADKHADWKMQYMLPIGVQCVSHSYGIKTTGSTAEDRSNATAVTTTTLYEPGDRVAFWSPTAAVGPSWMLKMESTRVKDVKLFEYLSASGSSTKDAISVRAAGKGEDLKVVICERKAMDKGPWDPMTTVQPLVVKDSNGSDSLTTRRAASFKVDKLTGLVVVQLSADAKAISDVRRQRWTLLAVLVGLVSLLCLVYFGINYSAMSAKRERVQWINDFYSKHAPEKLSDPKFATRLADKYADNMFVLWRSLEKTYKVKWTPPSSILQSKEEM